MILDEFNEFCDATALNTGAAASYLLGDQIDLGATVPGDIGNGEPVYLVVQVSTAVTGAATSTLQIHLASDAAAAMTPATATRHFSTGAFDAAAGIAAGTVLAVVALPMEGNAYERYLGIVQTTGVAAVTAGAINAFLTRDVSKWVATPDAL
jgi:hypothetical protein